MEDLNDFKASEGLKCILSFFSSRLPVGHLRTMNVLPLPHIGKG